MRSYTLRMNLAQGENLLSDQINIEVDSIQDGAVIAALMFEKYGRFSSIIAYKLDNGNTASVVIEEQGMYFVKQKTGSSEEMDDYSVIGYSNNIGSRIIYWEF